MPITVSVPPEYGYVVAAGILSVLVSTVLSLARASAPPKKMRLRLRPPADKPPQALPLAPAGAIPQPAGPQPPANIVQPAPPAQLPTYSVDFTPPRQGDPSDMHSSVLFLLLAGGLLYPLLSAAAGLAWSLGRVAYVCGFVYGESRLSRSLASPLLFGSLGFLLFTAAATAESLLQPSAPIGIRLGLGLSSGPVPSL